RSVRHQVRSGRPDLLLIGNSISAAWHPGAISSWVEGRRCARTLLLPVLRAVEASHLASKKGVFNFANSTLRNSKTSLFPGSTPLKEGDFFDENRVLRKKEKRGSGVRCQEKRSAVAELEG